MTEYLTVDHPDAFVDFEKLATPNDQRTCECPQCHGHGGWNLRLNAYPLPTGYENTPANRHRYVHFQASCSHCNGWGWVKLEDADHIHNWQFEENLGRCFNRHRCTICKKAWDIDSSD